MSQRQPQDRSPALNIRDYKSSRFNNFLPGDKVYIRRFEPQRGSGEVENQEAVLVEPAVWPNTWLRVRVPGRPQLLKVRTTNLLTVSEAKHHLEETKGKAAEKHWTTSSSEVCLP